MEDAYSVRSVQRVCDIIDMLRMSPEPVAQSRIAAVTGLPKSSVLRYLSTLEGRQYVQRDPVTGGYQLGSAMLASPFERMELLRQITRPHLEELRQRYDETANLGVLDGVTVKYVEVIERTRGVRLASQPGVRDPIHCTSLGKAIASQLSDERIRAILSVAGMESLTPNTIISVDAFLAEMENIRRRGYAVEDSESDPDGRCVGVPLAIDGIHGALSLSAPATRLPKKQIPEVAAALNDAAAAINDAVKSFSPDR